MIPSLLERRRETHRGEEEEVRREVKRPVCRDRVGMRREEVDTQVES